MVIAILVAPVVIEHGGCASSNAVDTRSHWVCRSPGNVGIDRLVGGCDSGHLHVSNMPIVSVVSMRPMGAMESNRSVGSVGVTPSGGSRGRRRPAARTPALNEAVAPVRDRRRRRGRRRSGRGRAPLFEAAGEAFFFGPVLLLFLVPALVLVFFPLALVFFLAVPRVLLVSDAATILTILLALLLTGGAGELGTLQHRPRHSVGGAGGEDGSSAAQRIVLVGKIAVLDLEFSIIPCQHAVLIAEPVVFLLDVLVLFLERGNALLESLILGFEVGNGGRCLGELLVGLFQ